jgi:DNA-binding protein H-NS
MGFSLAELTGGHDPQTVAVGGEICQSGDKSDTWSGRGRKPRWFSEALAKGKKPRGYGDLNLSFGI